MIAPPRTAGSHLPSLVLALTSGFGLLVGLLGVVMVGLAAVMPAGVRPWAGAQNMATLAWVAGLVALLNVPALIYSIPPAAGHPAPEWELKKGWQLASIALVLWLADLAVGSLLAPHLGRSLTALRPLFTIVAVAIPIWWLIEFGRRGLRTTPQRAWGATSFSIVITMPSVLIIELGGLVVLGLLLLIQLAGSSPDFFIRIRELVQAMAEGSAQPESLLELLTPYLEQPGVVFAGVAAISIAGPLVEEVLKPLALWFIPRRRLTEAEGFALGLIAGGMFALLETLLATISVGSQDWTFVVLARVATALLHITCSGLVGWGLAGAWQGRKYLQLFALFLLAVFLHGAWNLLTLLTAVGELYPSFAGMAAIAPFFLVSLAIAALVVLAFCNRRLRQLQLSEPLEPAAPPPLAAPSPARYNPYAPPPPGRLTPAPPTYESFPQSRPDEHAAPPSTLPSLVEPVPPVAAVESTSAEVESSPGVPETPDKPAGSDDLPDL